ncbi:MAG: hypothetical protein K0S55_551 [Clostridia bacterium]|nr:hypothetical protein [Clostridia bacterium]
MFILNGETISGHADFCKWFNYIEIIKNIDNFSRWIEENGSGMVPIRGIITEVCELLHLADDDTFEIKFDENYSFIFSKEVDGKLSKFINDKKQLINSVSKIICKTVLSEDLKKKAWCQALALYSAARNDFFEQTVSTIELCYGRQIKTENAFKSEKEKIYGEEKTLANDYNIYSGDVRTYKLYNYSIGNKTNFEIKTRKVKNLSPYNGDTAVIRMLKSDQIECQYELARDEYIYINTIDNVPVKVLTNIAYSNGIFVCRPNFNKRELLKCIINTGNTDIIKQSTFDPNLYDEASCFSVDYKGGLITIENGKLNNMSSVPYEGIENLADSDLSFVEAYVNGTKFLLLTNRGYTISNINKLNELEEIISIGFTNSSAYADKITGERISCKINANNDSNLNFNNKDEDIREYLIVENVEIAIMKDGTCRCRKINQ